jgi:hypothetical protein
MVFCLRGNVKLTIFIFQMTLSLFGAIRILLLTNGWSLLFMVLPIRKIVLISGPSWLNLVKTMMSPGSLLGISMLLLLNQISWEAVPLIVLLAILFALFWINLVSLIWDFLETHTLGLIINKDIVWLKKGLIGVLPQSNRSTFSLPFPSPVYQLILLIIILYS